MPVFELSENSRIIAKQAKLSLRNQMRTVRGMIPQGSLVARAQAVQDGLMQLPAFARAKVVVLHALPHGRRGVEATRLAAEARALGKVVAYPRVDFDAQRVTFHRARQADLEQRGLSTAEAPARAPIVPADTVDLIVVPVLAVDPTGAFVGDGSGAYDHALQHTARAVSVAVAFEFQLIPEAPRSSNDVPVAVVVTDKRVIEARGERSGEDTTVETSRSDRAVKEVRRAKQPNSVDGPVARANGGGDRARGRVGQRA